MVTMKGGEARLRGLVLCALFVAPAVTALPTGTDPATLQQLMLPLQTALKGTSLKSSDILGGEPNWSALIIETLAVLQKPGFLSGSEAVKAQALRGLYTLWYAAGETLGLLPTLPTQQKDILPAFAADLPVSSELSIKDGRLGYTNKTLTWQNVEQSIPPAEPGKVIVPSTVEEVVSAVSTARAAGAKLRCVSHGHTWTPVFFDAGAHVVFISELTLPSGKRIEYAGVDAQGFPLVRVAPGVVNGELSEWTDNNAEMLGYASLPTTTVITTTRMSGVISTGSHGKGLGFGAIADFVHSLKIVVGDGTIVEYDASHPYFNEARMNFGLMGVIVEIVFSLSSKKVSPQLPIVYDNNTFPTLRELFGRPDAGAYMKSFVTSQYTTEFLYFPLNQGNLPAGSTHKPKFNISTWDYLDDKVWIVAATRAALPPNGTDYVKFSNNALAHRSLALNAGTYLGGLLSVLGQQTGNIDIQVLSAKFQVLLLEDVIVSNGLKSIPAQTHIQPGVQQEHIFDAEFVFKVDDDFGNFIQMFTVAIEIARNFTIQYGSNPLNTALEWRFTGGSNVTLEGNRGASQDIYCWMEVAATAWTPHWDEFVRAIFNAWTAIEPTLKPHWAKWNVYTEDQLLHNGQGQGSGQYWEEHLKQVMGPQIAELRPAVLEADSSGVFAQKYLYGLLGL